MPTSSRPRRRRKSKATPKVHTPESVAKLILRLPSDTSLSEMIDRLCELELKSMAGYHREWLEELGKEVSLRELVRGERLPAVTTLEEMMILLKAPNNERDQLIFQTFYASGIRVAELTKLLVADVRVSECTLFVRAGKGNKDRFVLIDAGTAARLGAWIAGKPPDERVFPLSPRQVERLVTKWGKACGLHQRYQAQDRNLTPHSFRHSFATHSYANGVDLFALKKWLGHDYLDTTEQYIETSMTRWRAVYEQFHPLARQAREKGRYDRSMTE